jgi:hypothetical protein
MLAEKELQECQQRNQTNINDHLNQILERVEQAFAKVETAIRRRVATFAPAIAFSPPPLSTHTLESSKTLNHAEIVQTNEEKSASENKAIDIKSGNHQVPKLKILLCML